MKKLTGLLVTVLLLSVCLSACNGEENSFLGAVLGSDESVHGASYGTLREITIGTPFIYNPGYGYSGSMECTVTGVRLITEESQCPPEEWFFSPLSIMNLETGMAELVYREDWFTEGGAFDQGCRILVVDVTLKNIDAEGLPLEQGGYHKDPTVFDMAAIMNLVDTSIVYNDDGDYPTYQRSIEMGFSLLNQFIPEEDIVSEDPFIHNDSNKVQLPKGETVSFSLCYPVTQYDDGSPRKLSPLALLANDLAGDEVYIIPLKLEG